MTRSIGHGEADPVPAIEKLLRRIPSNPQYYDPQSALPIAPVAFRPTERDIDGISLFREFFTSAREVSAAGRKPFTYYVARLIVADMLKLGLTIRAAPDPEQPKGHVVIPEMSYSADRNRAKELAVKLARIAMNDIALHPSA